MIGNSVPEYIFIRTCIAGLRLVAPLSFVYTLASWREGRFLCSPWVGAYALVEACFYLFVYLPRSFLLQKAATHPPPLSRKEREALFEKCFGYIAKMNMATGWFFGGDASLIKRENMREWLLWALFGCNRDSARPEWDDEIEGYLAMLENYMGKPLEGGWSEVARCMRLTLDPVVMLHRPLVWYAIVGLVDTVTCVRLALAGFTHRDTRNPFSSFPFRLWSLFSQRTPEPSLAYWYRPHRSKTKLPVVFLHGIGIGLWPYVTFFRELAAQDPDVGIIAIENLSISMRISPPPLRRAHMLAALTTVLRHHNISTFVLAAHSYGTVLSAHVLRDAALSQRVAATLLIDPIPFLLYLPPVAYNFVYREPRAASEWQLWYLASRDPDIARALSRHFFWTENVLWKEDLEGRETAVVLCGEDQIVDSREVMAYLTGSEDLSLRWKKDGLEVLYFPGLDHSNQFYHEECRRPMIEVLSRFVNNGLTVEELSKSKES
ncbi:Alpha/Beta hydrolase protein [Fomitopsis serialis]|uniref:Alpha/Beta hydrolase protein n=1 Tax=Fomitopsis serialis TaxID=139415 RepID=UPI00200861C2|nr:Alpha/Beta hydrolase protein [Neoantrodia serialis]KAH9917611.1 Alpha/Beta hydrolase protein [Neoantrodia serialis]